MRETLPQSLVFMSHDLIYEGTNLLNLNMNLPSEIVNSYL